MLERLFCCAEFGVYADMEFSISAFLLSEMCGGIVVAALKALRKVLDGFKAHGAGYLRHRKVGRLE